MTLEIAVLAVVVVLAYANGGNDVSKGVATLVGSGVTDCRRAILWGAVWTTIGGAVATVAAGAMLRTFGDGLLAADVEPTLPAAIAALGGAGAWVVIATRTSLPVSTTHALVGAVVGSSVAAHGVGGVAWHALGGKVVLPLLASPLVAILGARVVLRSLTLVFGPAAAGADCLCFTSEVSALVPHPAAGSGALLSRAPAAWALARGHAETCAVGRSTAWHITVDRLHWLSSAAVSLARGMNDAPKIVALALGAAALSQGDAMGGPGRLYLFVIVSMAAGSLLAGLRVTRMLAHDITPMDARQGLAANAVTAALVSTGALYGWPMSTTHVSTGGIVGMGRARGSVAWCQVGRIGLAWVVTLPAAAVLAATAFWVLEGAV